MSICVHSSSGNAEAGAGFIRSGPPAWCARSTAVWIAETGTSSCTISIRALSINAKARETLTVSSRPFAPAARTMRFWPLSSTQIDATPVCVDASAPDLARVDAVGGEAGLQRVAVRVDSHPADHGDAGAHACAGNRLVRALAAGQHREIVAGNGLAADRGTRHPHDQVHVEAANDDDRGARGGVGGRVHEWTPCAVKAGAALDTRSRSSGCRIRCRAAVRPPWRRSSSRLAAPVPMASFGWAMVVSGGDV